MEDNQAMKDYIQGEWIEADDWKISKRFVMKQKLVWNATWLPQQSNESE